MNVINASTYSSFILECPTLIISDSLKLVAFILLATGEGFLLGEDLLWDITLIITHRGEDHGHLLRTGEPA